VIHAIVTDLEFARTTQVAVQLTIFTGVPSVDEDGQFVRLYDPQTFGDATTGVVGLNDITSITVTDVEYLID